MTPALLAPSSPLPTKQPRIQPEIKLKMEAICCPLPPSLGQSYQTGLKNGAGKIPFILVPGIAMLKSADPKKALPSDIEQGYLMSGGPQPHGHSVPSFGTACYAPLSWLLPCFPSLNTQSLVSTMRVLPCSWRAVPGLIPRVYRTAAPTSSPAQTLAQLAVPVPWAPLP